MVRFCWDLACKKMQTEREVDRRRMTQTASLFFPSRVKLNSQVTKSRNTSLVCRRLQTPLNQFQMVCGSAASSQQHLSCVLLFSVGHRPEGCLPGIQFLKSIVYALPSPPPIVNPIPASLFLYYCESLILILNQNNKALCDA